jgi:hypothetical protein
MVELKATHISFCIPTPRKSAATRVNTDFSAFLGLESFYTIGLVPPIGDRRLSYTIAV